MCQFHTTNDEGTVLAAPPCRRKVMIWGEHCGGSAGGTMLVAEEWQPEYTAEKRHLPSVLVAAADCLGLSSKGASRLSSLWKPQLTKPCFISYHVAGDHSQETRSASLQLHLPEERIFFHTVPCEQSQTPAVPQTVPGMRMLSGCRLTLYPMDKMVQCSRPHPGSAWWPEEAKMRNMDTAILELRISKWDVMLDVGVTVGS